MQKRIKSVTAAVAALLILTLTLFMSGCGIARDGADVRLPKKIIVDGLDVSGMTVVQARERIAELQQEKLKQTKLRVVLDDKNVLISGDQLPISFDTDAVLDIALAQSDIFYFSDEYRSFDSSMYFDDEKALAELSSKLKMLDIEPASATASYDADVEGFFVYSREVAGKAINLESVIAAIRAALYDGFDTDTIIADFTHIQPQIDVETLKAQNVLICEFTTSYNKPPHNSSGRVFNIKKAASLIDGVTVHPGEEFDMNSILGPRNGETGWRKAPGIRDGRYEMEYGGGVCQVSSTLFNAVMMADLNITERRPHSWPLTYVPIGRDATISTGGPNFKFINQYETPITVSASIDNKANKITVRIFGKALPDNTTIKITFKQTGTIKNPGDTVLLDNSLAPNTTVVDRQSRAGKRAETYKEYYDADGNLVRSEMAHKDVYRAVKGIVYVSPDIYEAQ